MRRMEQNIAEKRVLLQSTEMKNSLRVTYERLKLEEKAFISSTKFNQRKLLSRQNKLRQLQSTTQNSKGLSSEKRPKFRTSFPELSATSEGVIRGYPSNVTLSSSKRSLQTSGEGKHAKSLVGNEASDREQSRLNASNKFFYTAFKGVANEKQNEFQVPLKQGQTNFEVDLKTKQIGLHVDDIIAYSTRFGKRMERSRKEMSSTDREYVDTAENREPSCKNDNFSVRNEETWKGNVDSLAATQRKMCETTRYPEKEDLSSSENDVRRVKRKTDRLVYFTSDQSPQVISDEIKTGKESETNEDEPTVVLRTEDRLPTDVTVRNTDGLAKNSVQLNTNTTSEKLKTLTESRISNSLLNQEIDGPNVFVSVHSNPSLDQLEDGFERPSSSVRPLISRNFSRNGYEDLPALGRIRRGSICDVKTFTSGKVLDLLSLCEVPNPDSEETKQYLEVDHENLKYCRYLRSVTPDEALQDGERLGIPQKYRPSKNIIIGHTKISPLQ